MDPRIIQFVKAVSRLNIADGNMLSAERFEEITQDIFSRLPEVCELVGVPYVVHQGDFSRALPPVGDC